MSENPAPGDYFTQAALRQTAEVQQAPEPKPHSKYDPAFWSKRAKLITAGVAAAVVLIVVLVVVLWPRSLTVHGIDVDESGTSAFSTGTQVVIEAPDGSVIASGNLTENAKQEAYVNSGLNGPDAALNALASQFGQGVSPAAVFDWTVTVPDEPRYGIKVGSLAPFWVSKAEMAAGPVLTYGSG